MLLILPYWPRLYSRLCNDQDRRVREMTQKAHFVGKLLPNYKKAEDNKTFICLEGKGRCKSFPTVKFMKGLLLSFRRMHGVLVRPFCGHFFGQLWLILASF